MGHAWKELAGESTGLFSGSSLRYRPTKPRYRDSGPVPLVSPLFSQLDSETGPFGRDKLVSAIPTADMLRFVRSSKSEKEKSSVPGTLLVFESIPWIPEEEMRETASTEPQAEKGSRKAVGWRAHRAADSDQSGVPKPVRIRGSFAEDVQEIRRMGCAGRDCGTVTEYKDGGKNVALLAVPLAMTDTVEADSPAVFSFFHRTKKGSALFMRRPCFRLPSHQGYWSCLCRGSKFRTRKPQPERVRFCSTPHAVRWTFEAGMVDYSDANLGGLKSPLADHTEEAFAASPSGSGAARVHKRYAGGAGLFIQWKAARVGGLDIDGRPRASGEGRKPRTAANPAEWRADP